MKIRLDFVTNSSSSSYTLDDEDDQLQYFQDIEEKYLALREMLVRRGVMTDKEINELIDSKLIMDKLGGDEK